MSLFLSRPEWTTLIYQRLSRPGAANLDEALVFACLLMVLALLALLVLEYQPASRRLPYLSTSSIVGHYGTCLSSKTFKKYWSRQQAGPEPWRTS